MQGIEIRIKIYTRARMVIFSCFEFVMFRMKSQIFFLCITISCQTSAVKECHN